MARPKLRRRPFGYKASDVDAALEARDAELGELRQDVAALWLAFAQHDRMIRSGLDAGDDGSARAADSEPTSAAHRGMHPRSPSRPGDGSTPLPDAEAPVGSASVGRQLAELDEVLAAIELATQTLERTYAEEIGEEYDPDAGS